MLARVVFIRAVFPQCLSVAVAAACGALKEEMLAPSVVPVTELATPKLRGMV